MGSVSLSARHDLERRMNRHLLDYTPDMEFLDETAMRGAPAPADPHAVLTFGAGLLEIADEAELEDFLADLVRSVAAAGRTPLAAPLGKALVSVLKRAAQAILPIHSSGAGAARFGSDSGADLKTRAARIFGMELEGLSPEDKEYEVAQQFIRFAADTVGTAGAAARTGVPQTLAGAALQQAARRHAPGLLHQEAQSPPHSGHWRRQGRRIVVLNC